MGIIKNFLDNQAVKNAVRQHDASLRAGRNSQLNDYNGFQTDIYTRNYRDQFFDGVNRGGKYDNFYADYNRIIQVAPTFPLFFINKDNEVENGIDFVKYLKQPNTDYPQFKVLQQIYSEMITRGYSDVFLWRKDGSSETNIFEGNKIYDRDDFRGITLLSGYDQIRVSSREMLNVVRFTYGAAQGNVFMGYSPSQAAASWLRMQDEMGLHMTAFARNAGMPIGKFIITAESPEEFVKARDSLDSKIAGAKNNGKVLYDYRPSNSKVSQIEWVQFTSQDVQDYTKQLEFSEKKMSQSFGVPGTVKGTNDGENYATARVSEHIFIKYTIKSLVEDFLSQLQHAISQRFDLQGGEIKVDIPLPEIADESKVKIEATTLQRNLFYEEVAKGYTPESVIAAYDLPERFLLLELADDTASDVQEVVADEGASDDKNTEAEPFAHVHNHADEFERRYQNALTAAERKDIESGFRAATKAYAYAILKNGVSDEVRLAFEGKMAVVFSEQYSKLYSKSVNEVADALADALEAVDVAELELTDNELEAAVKRYNERVAAFSTTFAKQVDEIVGDTLKVRQRTAQSNIDRVVVTESEHTRIVSELGAWPKAQEDFPVRVYKTWNALPGACDECASLANTEIDVTSLFVDRSDPGFNEIFQVQGGGLHANCRCYVTYTMQGEDVRRYDGDN